MTEKITGYTFGTDKVPRSPVSLEELDMLKKAVLLNAEDEKHLRRAGEVLNDQIENILDVWYDFIGSQPHLVYYFTGPDGKPDANYLAAVRKRFGQWIIDTCNRSYDQDWLNYQYEIGMRHHRTKKNKTDNVDSVPNINARYLIALIYPITATMKPFLEKKGHRVEDVEQMYQAWCKAVVLQVALWSQPYIKEGDF